jgi:hypothetical protein
MLSSSSSASIGDVTAYVFVIKRVSNEEEKDIIAYISIFDGCFDFEKPILMILQYMLQFRFCRQSTSIFLDQHFSAILGCYERHLVAYLQHL